MFTTAWKNLVPKYYIGNCILYHLIYLNWVKSKLWFGKSCLSVKKWLKIRPYFDFDRKFCVGKSRLRLINTHLAQQQNRF